VRSRNRCVDITLNLKEEKRRALGFPDTMKHTYTGPDDPAIPAALDRARARSGASMSARKAACRLRVPPSAG